MKVSIIIPCYNSEKYLQACMDSVFAQTFSDFEAILIDDGSKDDTLKIAHEIEKQDGQDLEYNFEKSGKLTIQNVEEYLEKLELEIKAIDAYSDPFNEKVLTDEELGITEKNNES